MSFKNMKIFADAGTTWTKIVEVFDTEELPDDLSYKKLFLDNLHHFEASKDNDGQLIYHYVTSTSFIAKNSYFCAI